MSHDPTEVLSAFLDGEVVEPEALAEALASPGGRDALIDFVVLRAAAREDAAVPSATFYDALRWARRRRPIGASRSWVRAVALPAAAVLVLAVGIGIGRTLLDGDRGPDRPAQPPGASREVRFTDGVDWFRAS